MNKYGVSVRISINRQVLNIIFNGREQLCCSRAEPTTVSLRAVPVSSGESVLNEGYVPVPSVYSESPTDLQTDVDCSP